MHFGRYRFLPAVYKCHGRGPNDPYYSVCSVNPKPGIEHQLNVLVQQPSPSQKVAVIGGGPAGMKAAMELCDRGHKVTLFEKEGQLGGLIRHADYVDFKWTLTARSSSSPPTPWLSPPA